MLLTEHPRITRGSPVSDTSVAALSPNSDFVTACYIVAFSLFIFGIQQGTHPRTARRGNLIAAAGMLVAIAITLSTDVIGNGVLILIGILIGTAVGVVASLRVQMTDMPQMVALYNGVGGGAAALISWSEFRHVSAGGSSIPLDIFVPILFSTVIGSVSFWGSNIAFGKLQAIIPAGPFSSPVSKSSTGCSSPRSSPVASSWESTTTRRRRVSTSAS